MLSRRLVASEMPLINRPRTANTGTRQLNSALGVHLLVRVLPVLLVAGLSAKADELIYFKNGFTLAAVSHAERDTSIEVRVGTGTLLFPRDEVSKVEVLTPVKIAAAPLVKALETITPEKILYDAAIAQGVDAAFVRSVAIVESGLKQARISNKGAIGLMQLMPTTAKELGVDATKSDENARGGAQYLRSLLLRYQGDSALALAAYNAGPGAVQKFQGIPPYRETRQYVLAVIKEYNHQLRLQQADRKQMASVKKTNKPSATD